jgi:integrase
MSSACSATIFFSRAFSCSSAFSRCASSSFSAPYLMTPSVLLRRQLFPAMARASFPRVGPTQEKRTFHSFRHTFAKRR